MKLLTKEIRKKIPKLYAQEGKAREETIIHVKFFCPWNHWTWYATEGEPVLNDDGEEVDFHFFGYVKGDFNEWGYFSLNEIESVEGPYGLKIERDMWFDPKPMSEVIQ